MADTTHTRRQAQAIARREQLIRTGLRLFSEKGYRGASVRDIARAAGVTEGLLYHYFESKAALFRAVLDQYAPVSAFEDLLRAAATPQPAQRSFDEALRALGREFVARIREYRAFIVTMLTEAPSEPELGAILSDFLRSTNADIARFLTEYRKVGQIDVQIPIDAAARVLQGSLMFHFLMEALRPQSAPAEGDDALDDLFTVLLAGLAPRQTR
ncbi:MAG TPA: helix-turn-helix domain-containing protein [Ktedonobacterales bacterium]